MDGIHDMGGIHGFGKVEPEKDEPVFHAPWEGRVHAMEAAMEICRRLAHRPLTFRAREAAAADLSFRVLLPAVGAGAGKQCH